MIVAIVSILLLLLIDLPKLIQKKQYKVLAVYSVISLIVLIYMLQLTLSGSVFSPVMLLADFLSDKLGWSYQHWQGYMRIY